MATRRCDACGTEHKVLSSLPNRPVTVDELSALQENESIGYTGPTAMRFGPDIEEAATPMAVIQTETKTNVVSFIEEAGEWVITFTDENPDEAPEEYGSLINEMASQCIEAGYICVEAWMEDGEPGGNCPI